MAKTKKTSTYASELRKLQAEAQRLGITGMRQTDAGEKLVLDEIRQHLQIIRGDLSGSCK